MSARLKSYYGTSEFDPSRTLLGLGGDGHIASLFPVSAVLTERERWFVAVTEGALEASHQLDLSAAGEQPRVLFLIAGKERARHLGAHVSRRHRLAGDQA